MTLTELREKKEKRKKILQTKNNFERKDKKIILISIKNNEIRQFLEEGLSILDFQVISFGEKKEKNSSFNIAYIQDMMMDEYLALDVCVFDMNSDNVSFPELMKEGVIPVVPKNNSYKDILSQFNPMLFEWNSFLYEKEEKFHIFASVISVFENIKFPEDKRILLKNILATF